MKRFLKSNRWILYTAFEVILLAVSVLCRADFGVVLAVSVWTAIMIKLVSKLYNNIELLGFFISFFVFLIGGQVAVTYLGYTDYGVIFPQSIENHTNFVLLISMMCIVLGYYFVRNFHKENHIYRLADVKQKQMSMHYISLRQVSKCVFYIALTCSALMLLEKILFFRNSGDYYATYSEYKSSMPYIIKTIDNFMSLSFYIFLGTRPRKKEAMLPMCLYLIYLAGSLFTGRRIFIVTGLMMIAIYMIINDHETDDKWITKRLLRTAYILVPVFVIFLTVYGELRINESDHDFNIFNLFGKFIGSQGFTVNVIKYGKEDAAELGTDKFYSFYNTLRFLRTSPFTRWFMPDYNFTYGEYTIENAMNGNSFANSITYLNSPYTFLKGGGYGSCYIAELFHDFGYIGVILGNLFIGVLFGEMSRFRNHGVLTMALSLLFLDSMLKVPRYNFDYPVAELSIVFNWIYMFIVFAVARYLEPARRISVKIKI